MLSIARRLGSAMISNADSTLWVYATEHMLVNAYKGGGMDSSLLPQHSRPANNSITLAP
jgi:hypothetical protein